MARHTPELDAAGREYLPTASDAARRGGAVLLAHLKEGKKPAVTAKAQKDFVTEADRDAEDAVLALIRSRYPDHGILAEESHPSPGTGAEWIIDPLDGTTNFIHSYPFFGTSVAVRTAGEVVAGAVYDPIRDELFAARRGGGATLNGSPIQVSRVSRLEEALLVTGFPFRVIDQLPRFLDSLQRLIHASAGVRRDGSAALDCCYVACGRLDGFWEGSLSAWDIAAGALMVEEAGGRVSDFEGKRRFLDTGDIVASPATIHRSFLNEVRKAYG